MHALRLPDGSSGGLKAFDLSSLRPGGASHLLNACEDSEVVRRRGRWATVKTMEIYLQEVIYVTYIERLPGSTKQLINTAASGFPDHLQKAKGFVEANIPCTTWFYLLRSRRDFLGGDGSTSAAFGANQTHRCREPNQQRGHRRAANLYIYIYTYICIYKYV